MLKKYLSQCFSLDTKALSFMRIALGLSIIFDIIDRAASLEAHYTNAGIATSQASFHLFPNFAYLSPYYLIGSPLGMTFIFSVHLLAGILLLIGYKPKWVTPVTFILNVFLINRNPFITFGADYIITFLLFVGSFLPLGEHYTFSRTKKENRKVYSLATLVFFSQLFTIYLTAVITKLSNARWRNGDALYRVLAQEPTEWAQLLTTKYIGLTHFLNYFTLTSQSLILLLFIPIKKVRIFVFAVLLCLHLGMIPFMKLGVFPLTLIALLLPLLTFSSIKQLPTKSAFIKLQQAPLLLFLGLSLLNIFNIPPAHRALQSLSLTYHWSFFINTEMPLTQYVMKGTTLSGEEFDLIRNKVFSIKEQHTEVSKRAYIRDLYLLVTVDHYGFFKNEFSNYLCRQNPEFKNVQFYKTERDFLEGRSLSQEHKTVIINSDCH